jgi:hypothetical protein
LQFEVGCAGRRFTLRLKTANAHAAPFPSQTDGAARITPAIIHGPIPASGINKVSKLKSAARRVLAPMKAASLR